MKNKLRRPKIYFYFSDYVFHWLPRIKISELHWKDKFDTPRCEYPPKFEFTWLWWIVSIIKGDDDYWERWLWINKYHDGDFKKARESWPWTDLQDNDTWEKYNE